MTLQIDASTWRLPGFVEQAFHREELVDGRALGNVPPPARGQHVAIQVDMFAGFSEGSESWGIIKGPIDAVLDDGLLAVHATLTSEGPAILDATWQLVLRHYPAQANDSPWFVERMSSEGFVTVPRLWPRSIVDHMRKRHVLTCNDAMLPDLLAALRAAALCHATTPDPYTCANLTSRALFKVFKSHPAVDKCSFERADLTAALTRVWGLER